MKQILVKRGKACAMEIPAPSIIKNDVLVQVHYSCISTGTEMSLIQSSGKASLTKVCKQSKRAQKVIYSIKNEGLINTIKKVHGKLEEWTQTGYSASGVVVDVGSNIKDIEKGARVACVGAGVANHAEYIAVPRNLFVRIPNGVGFDEASSVALGSIAMQGVRRADVKLGEYVAVIGLGLIGQITVQLLKSNGCWVIGIDLDERRIQKAITLGLDVGFNSKDEHLVRTVMDYSNGFGVDAAIITAATQSNEPLSQAFKICRKKGRVVLVGAVGMELNREDMYKKELDFLISSSYGPGRYDENYEKKGINYPYAFVRWTETRNMEEYLKLIANKKINIKPLIERQYNITEASGAYEELKKAENKPLMVLLKYNPEKETPILTKVEIKNVKVKKDDKINIAVIGAGTFAKNVHLPNLISLNEYYNIYAIMSKTGSNAKSVAKKFRAKYATTDFNEILEDNNVGAVIISTRHNLHTQMAIDALKANKAVFLEKPMALNKNELDRLVKTINETKMPFMVGFNRRFSKYAQEVKKHISKRMNPMIVNYQMNAGFIPFDHWVYTEEGGGRIIGEACHILDLFNYFTDAEVETIRVEKVNPKSSSLRAEDNVAVILKYRDGSVCNFIYTTLGDKHYPKESCQIYFDRKIITIDDYKKLKGYGLKLAEFKSNKASKGQYEELAEFARYLKGYIQTPIPLWQMIQATEISFRIDDRIERIEN